MRTLYESDFYLWCLEQSQRLLSENTAMLDFKNLAEEILSMGRSERRELISRLEIQILHVLKWEYQPEKRSNSWQYTINEQTRRIHRLLKDNPSLKSEYQECVHQAYEEARDMAACETGLKIETFPQEEGWLAEWYSKFCEKEKL